MKPKKDTTKLIYELKRIGNEKMVSNTKSNPKKGTDTNKMYFTS